MNLFKAVGNPSGQKAKATISGIINNLGSARSKEEQKAAP
jgi:hypothetical protein